MPFSNEGIAYLTIDDVFEAFAAAVNADLRQASLALKSRDSLEAAIMRPLQVGTLPIGRHCFAGRCPGTWDQ